MRKPPRERESRPLILQGTLQSKHCLLKVTKSSAGLLPNRVPDRARPGVLGPANHDIPPPFFTTSASRRDCYAPFPLLLTLCLLSRGFWPIEITDCYHPKFVLTLSCCIELAPHAHTVGAKKFDTPLSVCVGRIHTPLTVCPNKFRT